MNLFGFPHRKSDGPPSQLGFTGRFSSPPIFRARPPALLLGGVESNFPYVQIYEPDSPPPYAGDADLALVPLQLLAGVGGGKI